MRALIDTQHLCFAATVTPDGHPNLSPKGTIRVWDDEHIFFCDIASPNTRRNLEKNQWIELNVVDPLSRRGYRFLGRATLHKNDSVYEKAIKQITTEENAEYQVHSVVLVKVERAVPLFSPGYKHVPDELEMRKMWRARRSQFETQFEAHISRRGPHRA